MAFLDAQQGRALAVILSTMSLLAHIGAFIVIETALTRTWTGSWYAIYDLFAIFASLTGVTGAVDRRPVMFSIYAVVHTITLIMITGVLLLNALPTSIASTIPLLSQQLRYAEDLERSMCREDGFGWDEHWLDQCRSAFAILSTGAIWIGSAIIAAQWWAISEVWSWAGSEWRRGSEKRLANIEKAGCVNKKQG